MRFSARCGQGLDVHEIAADLFDEELHRVVRCHNGGGGVWPAVSEASVSLDAPGEGEAAQCDRQQSLWS